jgi:hypothetical protein
MEEAHKKACEDYEKLRLKNLNLKVGAPAEEKKCPHHGNEFPPLYHSGVLS